MVELTPLQRFLATNIAQFLGALLLLFIGLIPFANDHQINIGIGVTWIIYMMAVIFAALFAGGGWALWHAQKHNGLDHCCVNRTIWTYVIVDIVVVLFLVCQEGGLCRSIFVPLFFLIPIALMIVEPHDKLKRVYIVLFVLIMCILISYMVSRYVGVPAESKVERLPLFGGRSLAVTYFSELAHPGYDVSVFIVSLISVVIPLFQKFGIGVIKLMRDREVIAEPPHHVEEPS